MIPRRETLAPSELWNLYLYELRQLVDALEHESQEGIAQRRTRIKELDVLIKERQGVVRKTLKLGEDALPTNPE